MLLILFFIIVLNIVAIALTYYCLSDAEKREKLIFIAIGVAIIYVLTSVVYWISTKDVAIKEVSELGKNLITFLFVPINGIILLPILAKSYVKYKKGRIDLDKLKNRILVLVMILAIILIVECMYFKDIQNQVVNIVEKNQQEQMEMKQKQPQIVPNEQANEMSNTEIHNNIVSNSIANSVQVKEIENQILNETITNTTGNNVN